MCRRSLLKSLPVAQVVVVLALLCPPPLVWATQNQYAGQYGEPAHVSIDDLLQMPEPYVGTAVHTKGRLELTSAASGGPQYALRGTFGGRLYVQTMREAAWDWERNAPRWVGAEVEVSGIISMGTDAEAGNRAVVIGIWSFLGPPEGRPADREQVTETKLEDLVTRPGKLDGRKVRVRGQFRGNNLFGDLPSASRRKSSDWVIKEDLFAAWVSGKKPQGSGWKLDAELKRDSGKWLDITGRVTTRGGVVTIDADAVALSTPPSPTAQALPVPRPSPRPKKPPVIVFSMPLDGERDVAANTLFKVQFGSDMNESSFKGRVVLRYAGRPRPGDREFDAARLAYDGGRRALVLDPGDLLHPGRIVEMVFLSGIVDIDGQPLQTRPGVQPGAAVDVLRFQTAFGAAGGLSR